MELKLSSAYEHLAGEPDLELKVLMLNVNEGHNKDLMEQCQTLKEYAIYVARVRKYASAQNLNDAVERAITECIKEGILVDFLRKNRSEVKMVSILEYDKSPCLHGETGQQRSGGTACESRISFRFALRSAAFRW